MVVVSVLLTPRYNVQWWNYAGCGGTVPAMAAPREWWLFTNSPVRHEFIVGVVVSVLASASPGRSRDVIVRGEWLSHRGLPAPRVRIPLPRPPGVGSRALDPIRGGELTPFRGPHVMVGVIVRVSISLNEVWAVLSHPE